VLALLLVAALVDPRLVAHALEGHYRKISGATVDFRQEFTNTVTGKVTKSTGKVHLQRPGRMYWQYEKPEVRQYVSDGKTLWFVDTPNKQVFVNSLQGANLSAAVTFLAGKGSLTRDFTISADTKCRRKGVYCLKLVPKQPSAQFQAIWLGVNTGNWSVAESLVLEPSGNENHFTFSNERKLVKGVKFTVPVADLEKNEGYKVLR
jgi:outer membrane lipoprotein carrier protein